MELKLDTTGCRKGVGGMVLGFCWKGLKMGCGGLGFGQTWLAAHQSTLKEGGVCLGMGRTSSRYMLDLYT